MPVFEYRCAANGRIVEVSHDAGVTLRNWGEVCFLAQLDPAGTDPSEPVVRIIASPPAVTVSTSDRELKEMGFTKLVRRDDGVYENVTADDGEEKYMVRGRKESMPHLHKKIRD